MTHLLPILDLMTEALRRRLALRDGAPGPEAWPDAWDEPAIRRMSPRELADLPWPAPAPRQGEAVALGRGEPPQEPPEEPHDLRPAA